MRVVLAAMAIATLSGCATNGGTQPKPAHIGGGPNQLRRAPCACVQIQQLPGSDIDQSLNAASSAVNA